MLNPFLRIQFFWQHASIFVRAKEEGATIVIRLAIGVLVYRLLIKAVLIGLLLWFLYYVHGAWWLVLGYIAFEAYHIVMLFRWKIVINKKKYVIYKHAHKLTRYSMVPPFHLEWVLNGIHHVYYENDYIFGFAEWNKSGRMIMEYFRSQDIKIGNDYWEL